MQIKQKFQILANSPTFLDSHTSSSPLFAPIDSLTQLLFETNICPFLPKLYGIYKNVEEIDFTVLPQSFVLKTNHDSGGVVIVPDKEAFLGDSKVFNEAMAKLTKHLNTNFYTLYREYHYKDIEPRIFAEELLGEQVDELNSLTNDSHTSQSHLNFKKNENHNFHNKFESFAPADTYKFHIFGNDDIHNYIQVTTDRFNDYQRTIMNCYWEKAPFGFIYDNNRITKIPKKPKELTLMYKISHFLASPFTYVRIDLYDVNDRIYVGELTFTHGGGTETLNPKEWDKKLGGLWKNKQSQAVLHTTTSH